MVDEWWIARKGMAFGLISAASGATGAFTPFILLRKPLFWIYGLSTLVQGLGFLFPSLYHPSYAIAIGLPSTNGALLLTLISIA